MRWKIFNIFILILCLAFASASFDVGKNSEVIKEYLVDSNFSGYVNISFEDQDSGSILLDSQENSITLFDLLNKNSNRLYSYSCENQDCQLGYSSTSPESQKIFSLNKGEEKILSFRFDDKIESIDSAEFYFESNAEISCLNQLEIDLFDDGIIDAGNKEKSSSSCEEKNYGCFDLESQMSEIKIGVTPFCQRIELTDAPGFKIGAWIQEKTPGTNKVFMSLYDDSGQEIDSCEIAKNQMSSSGSEASCEVNHSLEFTSADHYVCVYEESGSGEYKTRGYIPTEEKCGFNGVPIKTETNAYHIFVEKLKYGLVESQIVDGFSNDIENYIKQKYGSLDCSETCLVPIKIISNEDQQITLKNLKINYDKEGLPGIEESTFYESEVMYPEITSSYQELYLDEAGFLLSNEIGDYTYEIDLDGEEILEEEISIKNMSMVLYPKIVPILLKTTFNIDVDYSGNIIDYTWDFGDGTIKTTNSSSVEYTYETKGTYSLKVEFTNENNQKFSKTFSVNVEASKGVIEKKLSSLNSSIKIIESKMGVLDEFTKQMLVQYLDLENKKQKISTLEINFSQATSEEEYTDIILELINIDLPDNFLKVSTSKISFFPNQKNIDLDMVAQVQDEIYEISESENYVNGILIWNQNNMNSKIMMTEISLVSGETIMSAFKIFSFDLSPKATLDSDPDIFVKELDNMLISPNQSQNSVNGFVNFKLDNFKSFNIYTTDSSIEFVDFPLFLSPSLSEVYTHEEYIAPDEGKNWAPLIRLVLIIVLIILAVIAYIFIAKWYKKKYESHLFPNRNNLYNMINYVNNEKQKGTQDSTIRQNLKKVGWSQEQINYVMKKYAGKKIGMPGFK